MAKRVERRQRGQSFFIYIFSFFDTELALSLKEKAAVIVIIFPLSQPTQCVAIVVFVPLSSRVTMIFLDKSDV